MELGVAMSWIKAMMVENREIGMRSGLVGVHDRNWYLPGLSSTFSFTRSANCSP